MPPEQQATNATGGSQQKKQGNNGNGKKGKATAENDNNVLPVHQKEQHSQKHHHIQKEQHNQKHHHAHAKERSAALDDSECHMWEGIKDRDYAEYQEKVHELWVSLCNSQIRKTNLTVTGTRSTDTKNGHISEMPGSTIEKRHETLISSEVNRRIDQLKDNKWVGCECMMGQHLIADRFEGTIQSPAELIWYECCSIIYCKEGHVKSFTAIHAKAGTTEGVFYHERNTQGDKASLSIPGIVLMDQDGNVFKHQVARAHSIAGASQIPVMFAVCAARAAVENPNNFEFKTIDTFHRSTLAGLHAVYQKEEIGSMQSRTYFVLTIHEHLFGPHLASKKAKMELSSNNNSKSFQESLQKQLGNTTNEGSNPTNQAEYVSCSIAKAISKKWKAFRTASWKYHKKVLEYNERAANIMREAATRNRSNELPVESVISEKEKLHKVVTYYIDGSHGAKRTFSVPLDKLTDGTAAAHLKALNMLEHCSMFLMHENVTVHNANKDGKNTSKGSHNGNPSGKGAKHMQKNNETILADIALAINLLSDKNTHKMHDNMLSAHVEGICTVTFHKANANQESKHIANINKDGDKKQRVDTSFVEKGLPLREVHVSEKHLSKTRRMHRIVEEALRVCTDKPRHLCIKVHGPGKSVRETVIFQHYNQCTQANHAKETYATSTIHDGVAASPLVSEPRMEKIQGNGHVTGMNVSMEKVILPNITTLMLARVNDLFAALQSCSVQLVRERCTNTYALVKATCHWLKKDGSKVVLQMLYTLMFYEVPKIMNVSEKMQEEWKQFKEASEKLSLQPVTVSAKHMNKHPQSNSPLRFGEQMTAPTPIEIAKSMAALHAFEQQQGRSVDLGSLSLGASASAAERIFVR